MPGRGRPIVARGERPFDDDVRDAATSPKNGVVVAEKSSRSAGHVTDNRGWFRRALAAVATAGIVFGVLASAC